MDRREFLAYMGAAGFLITTGCEGDEPDFGPVVRPEKKPLAKVSVNQRMQHACVGVSSMGGVDRSAIADEGKGVLEIVALCDVDREKLRWAGSEHPDARLYTDWRVMLEKEGDKIDSVNVSTPDHMHAAIAMSAIKKGKHVYCQKPLTHSVHEARQLRLAANKYGVITQMGIQIHSHMAYRMAVKMLKDGAIGKVKEFHSWQSSTNSYQQGAPSEFNRVPKDLDWDSWIGVREFCNFKNQIYHPHNWRNWQEFGCGVLGDFACHIFDPIFYSLGISKVLNVQAVADKNNGYNWPGNTIVGYEFVGTEMTVGDTIKGYWYDGKHKPPKPLYPTEDNFKLAQAGSLIIGEKGTMHLPHFAGPMLYPFKEFKSYERPKLGAADHYRRWIQACMKGEKASAGFDYSGPLTEAVQLGNIATLVPDRQLIWNDEKLKFDNNEQANKLIKRKYRSGWEIEELM
ncbi:MAG: Gfo/Idh/MocA family oxidoreductase [Phycisphaerae bacterium]|nr:Gfo/Idh/MocA family oxidoreductase [Phycisphaerae bacterium]